MLKPRTIIFDYETLDAIADSYIPLLAIAFMLIIVKSGFRSQWQVTGLRLVSLLGGLSITYGLMLLDNLSHIASVYGLDYSTHTAVALVLTYCLVFNSGYPKSWLLSFIAYLLLMLYQRYHTLSDIIVTGTIVGFFTYWLFRGLYRQRLRSIFNQ